jgi:hypothetical protein
MHYAIQQIKPPASSLYTTVRITVPESLSLNHCPLYMGATTAPLVDGCDIDVPFSVAPP